MSDEKMVCWRCDLPLDREERSGEWFHTATAERVCERERIASLLDRWSGNRNPDDPETSNIRSRAYMYAADRIRHPDYYEGVAQGAPPVPVDAPTGDTA